MCFLAIFMSLEKCVFDLLCIFFIALFAFFDIELQVLFVYFGDQSHVGLTICKYFLPLRKLSFCFIYGFLCCAKAFNYILLFFIFITLGGGSKKILLWSMLKDVLPMFSSVSFIISSLTFRYLVCFEFIFGYGVRECSNFILLHVAVQASQHYLQRLSFLHCLCASFVVDWVTVSVSIISGFAILRHWSVSLLCVCQYHTFDRCIFVV